MFARRVSAENPAGSRNLDSVIENQHGVAVGPAGQVAAQFHLGCRGGLQTAQSNKTHHQCESAAYGPTQEPSTHVNPPLSTNHLMDLFLRRSRLQPRRKRLRARGSPEDSLGFQPSIYEKSSSAFPRFRTWSSPLRSTPSSSLSPSGVLPPWPSLFRSIADRSSRVRAPRTGFLCRCASPRPHPSSNPAYQPQTRSARS